MSIFVFHNSGGMTAINVKRIYSPAEDTDGFRILVDRLWPRGVTKEKAALNLWLKDIAPSNELRQQFHASNSPDKWSSFKAAYLVELKQNPAVAQLAGIVRENSQVTLLYSVNNEEHNHALLLRDYIIRLVQLKN